MTRWAVVLISVAVAYGCTTQIVVPPASLTPIPTARPTPPPIDPPTASADPSPGVEHPTGATDVVLRMSEYGMPHPGMTLLAPPVFTLYGDGRAIYNISREPPAPGSRLDLRQARLADGQVDQLLADALGPGGLADARAEYSFTETFDLTYTYFEIQAAGLDKTVSAYALDHVGPGAIPDADAHRALGALAARLRNFGSDVASGMATDAGAFEPDAYEATLSVPSRGVEPTAVWPWQDLTPSDLGRAPDGNLVATVSVAHANAVLHAGLAQGFVATGPDGIDYVFRLRPLLPGELQ